MASLCSTRLLKNAKFLQSSEVGFLRGEEPIEGFASLVPAEVLRRLDRMRPEEIGIELLAQAVSKNRPPVKAARPVAPLFSGTLRFVQATFSSSGGSHTVPLADLETALKYTNLAIGPISAYASQYGSNSLAVASGFIPFEASLNGSQYNDSILAGWADQIAKANGLAADSCLVFLNPQGVVNTDADATQGVLGYHNISPGGVTYAFVNIMGQGLTIEDKADVYAVALSHEIAEMCLAGDTKIPLLDGSEVAVKDLVGRDHFWVYSCKSNGELRPGMGHSARLTRRNAEVVKVLLDNGHSITCTPDHKFLMRNGEYKQACELMPNDSLMPLYRRKHVLDERKKRKGMYEYEQVYSPALDDWTWTHRMVVPYCSQGYVRHHSNFNRFDNSPDNLRVMKWEEHQKLHSEHIKVYAVKGKKHNVSPEERRKSAERGRKQLIAYNKSEKHTLDLLRYWTPEERKRIGARLRPYAIENGRAAIPRLISPENLEKNRQRLIEYNKSKEHRRIAADLGRKMFETFHRDPVMKARILQSGRIGLMRYNQSPPAKQQQSQLPHLRWHISRGVSKPNCRFCAQTQERAALKNHKVKSVVSAGQSDVYDITVDMYHDFAVGAGVFVHNCVDPKANGSNPEVCDSCLPPDELLLGDNKPISDYAVGSMVTGQNGLEEVTDKFVRKYEGELVEIKALGMLPFRVTPNHPLMVARGQNTGLHICYSPPGWKEAGAVMPKVRGHNGDYLVMPRIQGARNDDKIDLEQYVTKHQASLKQTGQGARPRSHPHIKSLPLTEEVAWMFGVYVAEGSPNLAHRSVEFSLSSNEISVIEQLRGTIEPLGFHLYTEPIEGEEGVKVIVCSIILAKSMLELCGKGAENKRIPDVILYHSDKRIVRAFLRGYHTGDGSKKITQTGYEVSSFTTVSKLLALQLQLLYGRLGVFISLRKEREKRTGIIQGRTVEMKESYAGSWCSDARATRNKRLHPEGGINAFYLPVKRIRRNQYTGYVHNLETQDHTFLVSNLVVHNCAGNCGIDYRNYFDANGKWLGGIATSTYAFFIDGIATPATVAQCPAPASSCSYPPPRSS